MKNRLPFILLLCVFFLLSACEPFKEHQTGSVIQQETLEKGGTFDDWNQTLFKETGTESEEYKTMTECKSLMNKKIQECSQHQGWSVDNVMEVTNFKTGKHYEFQDVKRQDCSGTDKPPSKIHIDSASLDAQTDNTRTSAYQVVCSINCHWWDCTPDITGTWKGDYSEESGSSYCSFKEAGTKAFEFVIIDETSFRGTVKYSGKSVVASGKNCQGWQNSGTGTVSGSISGNKLSGTLVYHATTSIPFTATLNKDIIAGSYAYTSNEYGTPHSAKGTFKVMKK